MSRSIAFDTLPITAGNRPHLSRIDYAPDDLSRLIDRLIARLPDVLPGWNPTLAQGGGDYGVLIAESFARLAANLNAYADQRANEGFIGTATLPRSLIDLTQLIDYRLGNGASASALQAFIVKPGRSGVLPAGFRLNAVPAPGSAQLAQLAPLAFETRDALNVDPSRNAMRLSGFDRSGRMLMLRSNANAAQDREVLLDKVYSGLKAGMPIVFDGGSRSAALPVTAVVDSDIATRIGWTPGRSPLDLDLPIADLTIRGRPQQTARLAAAERADEITIGQTLLPVEQTAMFSVGSAVLLDSGGFQMAASVVSIHAAQGTLTLSRGVSASLRRSATRVLAGAPCGTSNDTIRAGSTSLPRSTIDHEPAAGDTLLIVDASGIEIATIAGVSSKSFTIAQPVIRALRPAASAYLAYEPGHAFGIRYFSVPSNADDAPQSALRSLRLGELKGVYEHGNSLLTLDKSVDAFIAGSMVALGDGTTFSAHSIVATESVEQRTRLTLAGKAPSELRVAFTSVYGAFAHAMHVRGYDHSEAQLAAGASMLDIDGAPVGLTAGMALVITDGATSEGAHAEGARITQLQVLPDRIRVSLSRTLERGHAIGDALIHGNVAEITHGASAGDNAGFETLGSGDPSVAPQRFSLRGSPLAWIADADAPRGVAPAIDVFVDGERWTRVDTLAGSQPLDRHFAIEIDEVERASVVFGDNHDGAAATSGRNNVTARYRIGRGSIANVAAHGIASTPQAASFIDSTFNPAPASGGADPETPARARQQARLRVRALDRAVSTADHADLALTYAGIGKAKASVEREGRGASARRVIVVTCAAVGGNALSAPQKDALLAFLSDRSCDPSRLRIRDHRTWPIRLALTVDVLPNFQQAAVQRALLAAFGHSDGGFFAFERRGLGASVALSDVYALAESVPGVDHVRATRFNAESDGPRVADRIDLPADALATGGDASNAAIGRLTLQLIGGLA